MDLNLPEKRYYGIGELAKAFGVSTSLIRFWEKEFKELKPKKNANGNRRFTQSDLEVFKTIFLLVKKKGYTLEGAKLQLKEPKESHTHKTPNSLIVEKLKTIKVELIKLKDSL